MAIKGLSTTQVIFLGTVIAMDIGFGMVAKTLMHATGISQFVHLEMVVPVMLLMLTRLVIDRFGILVLYELLWGTLAIFVMPWGQVPGPYRLLPLCFAGLAYDLTFSAFGRYPRGRVYLSAVIGGVVANILMQSARVMIGLPWATVTQALMGITTVASIPVHIIGAYLALVVWRRLSGTQLLNLVEA